ncbi:cell division protein PerM [Mumia sp. DW29H23]|uniref:cell division protein PerM n=1 Tax=Mumia sp. DW29H23 TaxID=3421241 RepID=UPI003D694B65
MIQTLRPSPSLTSRGRPGADGRPGWAAGATGAVLAAAVGLLLCGGLTVVVWLSADTGTAGGALRGGAIGWLAAHGSGVAVGNTVINALPLGLLALVVGLLHGAVARLAAGYGVADSAREVASAAAACGAAYAGILALVAWWSTLAAVHVEPWRAAIAGLVVGTLFGATGCAQGTGFARRQYEALPPLGRSALQGALIGAAVLVVTAALLVLGGLVVRLDAAGALWDGLRPDLLGGLGLLLLCLLVLPNLVLWNVAALLGPGYAVGAGTSVTLTSSTLGAVPGLPVLAALPPTGPRPGWLIALAAVPLVAGAIAGYAAVTPRSGRTSVPDLRTAVTAGGGSGALAGSAVAVGLLLSGGAIGPGRLGHSGPDVGLAVPLAIVVLAVGGAVGGAVAHYRGRRGADDDAAATAGPDTPDSTPAD